MSLNKKEIAERFFTLFTVKNQTALAEHLGITPSVVTEWKKGRSAVPWEKLDQAVNESGVTWDWLLLGRGEKYAVHAGKALSEAQSKTPPAEASGGQIKKEKEMAARSVFKLAGVFVELGQHLLDGKPFHAFLIPPELRGTLHTLGELPEASEILDKALIRDDRTA